MHIFRIVMVGVILLCLTPILLEPLAQGLAYAAGCELAPFSITVCVVGDRDVGAMLYTMASLIWALSLTLPVAMIALAILLGVEALSVIKRRRDMGPPPRS